MTLWRWVAPALGPADRALDRAREVLGDASRTVKFLRGREAFEPRPDDLFVASYPRSGTTWVQAICYLLLTGADGFDFDHISDVAPWWERSLAYRNDAARRFEALPAPRVFKTHLRPGWLPRGARSIYVERQVTDVALSYYHLYRDYLGWTGSLEAFAARFDAGDVQYGRWADHVAAWSAEPASRCLHLHYEQLHRDPVATISAIAEHLGLALDGRRARAIAEATDFATMRQSQAKFDHLGEVGFQLGFRPGRFVRRGAIGEGATRIDPELHRSIRAATSARPRPPFWRLPTYLH